MTMIVKNDIAMTGNGIDTAMTANAWIEESNGEIGNDWPNDGAAVTRHMVNTPGHPIVTP